MVDPIPVRLLPVDALPGRDAGSWAELLGLLAGPSTDGVVAFESRPSEVPGGWEARLREGPLTAPPETLAAYRDHIAKPSPPLAYWGLRDAYVFPWAGLVLTRDGTVLAPSAMGLTAEDPTRLQRFTGVPGFSLGPEGGLRLDPGLLAGAPVIAGPVLFPLHAACGTYGHWFFDCVPPLHAAAAAIRARQVRILTRPLAGWQMETIAGLGLDQPLLTVSDTVVRCERLVLPSFVSIANTRACGRITAEAMAALRDNLLGTAAPSRGRGGRIVYISRRSDPTRRRIVNEAELEAYLTAQGAAILRPEAMSLREQVALAASARLLVSPIGSGSMNTGFAPASATLVEVFPEGYVDPVFCRLALVGGQSYLPHQQGAALRDRSLEALAGFQPTHEHFSYRVDIDRLSRALSEIDPTIRPPPPSPCPQRAPAGVPRGPSSPVIVVAESGALSIRPLVSGGPPGRDGPPGWDGPLRLGEPAWSSGGSDALDEIFEPLLDPVPEVVLLEAGPTVADLARRLASLGRLVTEGAVIEVARLEGAPAAPSGAAPVARLALALATGAYGRFRLYAWIDGDDPRLSLAAERVSDRDLRLLARDALRLGIRALPEVPADLLGLCSNASRADLYRSPRRMAGTGEIGPEASPADRRLLQAYATSAAAAEPEGARCLPLLGRHAIAVAPRHAHLVSVDEAAQVIAAHPNIPGSGPLGTEAGHCAAVIRGVDAARGTAFAAAVAHGHPESGRVRFACRVRDAASREVLAEQVVVVQPSEWGVLSVPFVPPREALVDVELMSAMDWGIDTNRNAWARFLHPVLIAAPDP